MVRYYLWLAARSLRRNPILTVLMIAAIGLGIAAAMTSYTVLRAMSGNPMAHRDDRLYRPQIDNWSPQSPFNVAGDPPNMLSYRDATGLWRAARGQRQFASFPNALPLEPEDPNQRPFMASVLYTGADMFAMFDMAFRHGGPWSGDLETRDRVVVISASLSERLFGSENPTGRSLRLASESLRIVGVTEPFNPKPKFYQGGGDPFGEGEQIFLPFALGIDRELQSGTSNNCWSSPGVGYAAWLESECIWIDFWVELAGATEAARYRDFLAAYVADQSALGRSFARPDNLRLSRVSEWLEAMQVVGQDTRTQTWLAFAFLAVCLINTVALLLAKFLARAGEIGLRRAVGASRRTVFAQYLTEAGMVGLAGAVLGLGLTLAGLAGLRTLYAGTSVERLAVLDGGMVLITVSIAILASLVAGLYPTWRACQVTPAMQLKSN